MKIKKITLGILCLLAIFSFQVALASYTPLEKIPGTATTASINTFPAYVKAVYKFAIWSVGIGALLMISIGGFMYFTGAGNTSKMESGKKIIMDAIYGLLAVFFAWIILNTINPNLTNISLTSVSNIQTNNNNTNP